MIKKLLNVISAVVLVFSVAVVVYFMFGAMSHPSMKPVSNAVRVFTGEKTGEKIDETVKKNTLVEKINEYSCGDIEIYYHGFATPDLVGLDIDRLQMKYPESDGWRVIYLEDEVTILKKINGLCGMHKEYRHLGIVGGELAVFQGPLGYDEVLLRLEKNIAVNSLPDFYKGILKLSARFNELSQEEKLELQKVLEFANEHSLNSLLENFDELE